MTRLSLGVDWSGDIGLWFMDKQREMSKVNMDGFMYCSRFGDHGAWTITFKMATGSGREC